MLDRRTSGGGLAGMHGEAVMSATVVRHPAVPSPGVRSSPLHRSAGLQLGLATRVLIPLAGSSTVVVPGLREEPPRGGRRMGAGLSAPLLSPQAWPFITDN